jgi:predicted lactoylglutathione lyase
LITWILRLLINIAFSAGSKEEVDAFCAAALKAGGVDNGAPGYRPQYDDGHYAAFVLDLDGNNIEAVHRESKTR